MLVTQKLLEIVSKPHGAVQNPRRMEVKTSDFFQSLKEKGTVPFLPQNKGVRDSENTGIREGFMLFCLKSCSLHAKFIYLNLYSKGIRWSAQMPQAKAPLCKKEYRILCGTQNDLKRHQVFHKEACFYNEKIWGCFQSAFNRSVHILFVLN